MLRRYLRVIEDNPLKDTWREVSDLFPPAAYPPENDGSQSSFMRAVDKDFDEYLDWEAINWRSVLASLEPVNLGPEGIHRSKTKDNKRRTLRRVLCGVLVGCAA